MSNNITLKDFLKKYTAISNKFIDEYYSFYEQTETNKFSIKVEDVMKYLNIHNKRRFEERLRTKFILRKDYEIIRYLHKLEKGKKTQFIYFHLKVLKGSVWHQILKKVKCLGIIL